MSCHRVRSGTISIYRRINCLALRAVRPPVASVDTRRACHFKFLSNAKCVPRLVFSYVVALLACYLLLQLSVDGYTSSVFSPIFCNLVKTMRSIFKVTHNRYEILVNTCTNFFFLQPRPSLVVSPPIFPLSKISGDGARTRQ